MAKYIYGLIDPSTNQLRYVGQTDDLNKRLQQHMQDGGNTPKVEWLRGLKSIGQQAIIIVLSVVKDGENAHEIEYRWIYFGRQNGWPLTNTAAMKTMEYYSLQGYFERLIVEMEKPEGLPEQKHSWADVRERLLWLFATGLDQIPSLSRWIKDAFPFTFNLLPTFWYAFYLLDVLPATKLSPLQLLLGLTALFGGGLSVFVAVFGERWVKISFGILFIGLYFFAKKILVGA